MNAIPRVMLLWCPDWPITAAIRDAAVGADAAVALSAKGLVFASSAAARADGITRGLRVREAQSKSSGLTVLDYDPALDNRVFEPVIAGLEQLSPGVQLLRPGVCALRLRGVAAYYGGERAAALALVGRVDELGGGGARAGIADGIFTAEQAARRTGPERVRIVAAGDSAAYLAPLPIGLLDESGSTSAAAARSAGPAASIGIVTLLLRLGIRTLGEFAALDGGDVQARFGDRGALLHALAAGRDSWPVVPRTPPGDFGVVVDFEPALDRVDQVAFGVRASAERFIVAFTGARLVCTAIRVELESDSGEVAERVWLHPRSFSPADVVDRVRWQLEGSGVIDAALSSGIVQVRIAPEAVDAIGNHEAGLWGTGPDERIHHGLSRVHGMLGHGAVLMPGVGGGRTLADRQQFAAWGDPPVTGRPTSRPWPGRLPSPLPGTVFPTRHAVQVSAAGGDDVRVDRRGVLSADPVELSSGSTVLGIEAWAGPWPLEERWWSSQDARHSYRFQVVDSTGCGWLLLLDGSGWWAEARYD